MPTRPGIYTGEDVYIGDILLNSIDQDMVAWVVTDIEGWWGLPDVEVPDDPRPYSQDGSYYTTGRYGPRIVNLRGHILPLDGNASKAVTARNAFNRALNLVRSRAELKVKEEGVFKVALVQISGKPLMEISQATGLLTFDIALKATDPLKYADGNRYYGVGLQVSTPGRTYPRIFDFSYGGAATTNTVEIVNDGSYESFPEFSIAGPVLNPKIEHLNTGQILEFNTSITVGEPMTVRPLTKQVLVQGQNKRNTLSPRSKWFPMYPGTNTLRFSGTQTIPVQSAMNKQINRAVNPVPANVGNAGITGSELRRNRFPTPRPSVTTGFTDSGGTASPLAIQTYGGVRGDSNYIIRNLTAPVTASGVDMVINAPAVALRAVVVAGQTYIFGASIIHSNTPTNKATFYLNWLNSSGTSIATQTLSGLAPGPNGLWYRITNTATAPTNAAFVTVGVTVGAINGWQAGDFLGVTEFSVEDTSTNIGTVANSVPNPGPIDITGWPTGTDVTRSLVTDSGAPAMEITVTTAPSSASLLYTYVGQMSIPTVPGPGRWVAAAWEVKPMTTGVSAVMRGILRIQNGSTTVGDQGITPTGTAPSGQWTRMVTSAQQPVGSTADNVDLLVWPNGVLPVGASWRIRKAIIGYGDTQAEAEAAVANYIDGNTPNTATTLYAWSGASNNSTTLAIPVPEFFDGSTISDNRNHRVRWTGTVNASASTISIFNRGWDSGDINLFKAETTTSFVRRAGSTAVKFTRLARDAYDKRVASIVNIGQVASTQSYMLNLYPDFQNAATLYVNPSMEGLEAVFTFKYYSSSVLLSTVVSDPQTLSMGSWQRIKFIDPTPAPSNAVKVAVSLEIRYTGTDNAHIGAYVAVQDAKIGLWSTIDEDYFDGSYPFARWDGTAHWSESYIDNYVPEVPAARLYITSRDAWIE